MPPAARVSDMHVCPLVTVLVPHVGGPILPPCAVQVLIGGLPAARVSDLLVCVGPPDVIAMGSPTVLIGGLPAARMLDPTAHGGMIVLGDFTVMIGESGSGSGGGGGAGAGSIPTLSGVTAAEIALAAAPNAATAPELEAQVSARKAVAEAFFDKYCKHYEPTRIKQELKGIDFTKPVKARLSPPPPPPDATIQWQPKGGRKGNYFGNPGSLPVEMGVGELGLTPGPGPRRVVMKEQSRWKIAPGTPLLESTASKINDYWSLPAEEKDGAPIILGSAIAKRGVIQRTKGGATQYFVPDKNATVPAD